MYIVYFCCTHGVVVELVLVLDVVVLDVELDVLVDVDDDVDDVEVDVDELVVANASLRYFQVGVCPLVAI